MDEQQEKKIEDKLKIESQCKSGANWFFWIAGLSLINSVILLSGGSWSFIVGLGFTQIIDTVGLELAKEAGNAGTAIAFVLDVIVAGFFVFFGVFSRKNYNWAFVVGMIFYALDGLLFLLVPDYLSIGFHVFALFCVNSGRKANKILYKMEKGETLTPIDLLDVVRSKDARQKVEEQKGSRQRALRTLTDPCPYCNFNLKTGKEKCNECGKEFFQAAT